MTGRILTSPLRAWTRGVVNALPLQIATVPFAMIFGALAVEAGLTLAQTMAMTTIVVAGAAQMVALPMMVDQAPAWLVVFTAAFVNLRMAIYSAALALHWRRVGPWPRVLAAWFLNDQSYALSIRRYESREEPEPARTAYFFGVGCCGLTCWIGATLVGAVLGARIPESWPVDFGPPIVFIALVAPFLRRRADWAAAAVAGGGALALHDVGRGAGIVLAILAGIGTGLLVARSA
ncbi:MAG: AzlC family ABC transporter permease [Pseudomonadota bacterium]